MLYYITKTSRSQDYARNREVFLQKIYNSSVCGLALDVFDLDAYTVGVINGILGAAFLTVEHGDDTG